MSDIKKLLETMDRMSAAERKPTGPKFPGYWKGTDPASKAKDKMVGSAEESIIKDLNKVTKEKTLEWKLSEDYKQFKEQDSDAYTGIDPAVRQRMGMQPATQDQIRTYLDKNPPVLKTGTGDIVRSGSGAPVGSAGQIDVAKAADAVSPDRAQSVAREPSSAAAPVPTSAASAAAPAAVITPVAPRDNTSVVALPAAAVAQPVAPAPVRAPYRGSSSAREIQAINPSIRDVNKIRPGQRLKLPNSDEDYVVQRGDTLDKIGKMYRSGEIGGRVVGGDGPTSTPAARTQPAAPTSTSTATPAPSTASSSTAPSTSAASGPRRRPSPEAPRAVPPTSFDPPGPDTDTSDRPAPAASPQPAAPASTATPRTTHPSGTRVTAQIRDPRDPSKPLNVQLKKGDDGWYDDRGRKINFDKPGDLEKLEQLPANAPTFTDKMKRVLGGELPSRVFGQPKPPQNQTAPATQPPARPATQPAAPKSNSSSSKTDQSGMTSYATKGGRVYAADFNNPSGLGWDGKGKYTSYKTPEEGVNATRNLVTRYLTDQTPYIKGPATPEQVVSTWVTGGKTPADKIQGGRYLQSVKDELAAAGVKLDSKGRIPHSQAATDAITRAIVRHETAPKHMEKFAPFLTAPKDAKSAKGPVTETNREDEKIAGRYDPDDFDLMVKRLGQRAREQDRRHGPVDIAALAKRLKDIEQREQTKEQEDPAVNMQDPNIQRTSQTSPQQDPAAVKQQQLDQTVDMATAKGTMSGLKTALGPDVDTNALASAVTKISDGKPLTGPESTSMSALTPLISKAAETPQTAMALKTALSNAGMLAKQGK